MGVVFYGFSFPGVGVKERYKRTRNMKKSNKKFLSILFHLIVLAGMVMTYDAIHALGVSQGWIQAKEPKKESPPDESETGS